jgi:hypothetical protein
MLATFCRRRYVDHLKYTLIYQMPARAGILEVGKLVFLVR